MGTFSTDVFAAPLADDRYAYYELDKRAGVFVRDTETRTERLIPEPEGCNPQAVSGGLALVACNSSAAWSIIDPQAGTSGPIPGLAPGDEPLDGGAEWVEGVAAGDNQRFFLDWHTGRRVQLAAQDVPVITDLDQPDFRATRTPQTYPDFDFDGEKLSILVSRHTTVRRLPGCVLICRALAISSRFAVYAQPRYIGVYDIARKRFYGYRNTRWPKLDDEDFNAAVTLHELDFLGPARGGRGSLYRAELP